MGDSHKTEEGTVETILKLMKKEREVKEEDNSPAAIEARQRLIKQREHEIAQAMEVAKLKNRSRISAGGPSASTDGVRKSPRPPPIDVSHQEEHFPVGPA